VNEKAVAMKSPLALAFVGDAYMSLVVRKGLVEGVDYKVAKLHDIVSKIVCAKNQSKLFDKLFDELTEVERDIANRARNSSVNTVPSSCTLAEYKKATALEAVIGFNVLVGDLDRAGFFCYSNVSL